MAFMPSPSPAFAAILVGTLPFWSPASAQTNIRIRAVTEFIDDNVHPWLAEPVILNAIIAPSAVHARLSQAVLDDLDTRWRTELSRAERPMIEAQLSNPPSLQIRDPRIVIGTITFGVNLDAL